MGRWIIGGDDECEWMPWVVLDSLLEQFSLRKSFGIAGL